MMFVSEEAREKFKQDLMNAGFDGPIDLGGDFLSSRYGAVCTRCGALVLLNDMIDNPQGAEPDKIERSIYLHSRWHARIEREASHD